MIPGFSKIKIEGGGHFSHNTTLLLFLMEITRSIRHILDTTTSSHNDRRCLLWDLNLEEKERIAQLGRELYQQALILPSRCLPESLVFQEPTQFPSSFDSRRSLRSNAVLRILQEQQAASPNGIASFFSRSQAPRNEQDVRDEAIIQEEDLVQRTLPPTATNEERTALFSERYSRVHATLMADKRFSTVRPLEASDCTMVGLLNKETVTMCVSFMRPWDPYYQRLAGLNSYEEDLCEGDAESTDSSSMSLLRHRRGPYSNLAEHQYNRMSDVVERNGAFIFSNSFFLATLLEKIFYLHVPLYTC